MENHVDTLMKDAISIIGRSENIFGISSNMMRQLPPEPSRQEAFKDLVMNFILDQEEKVKKLKEYMGAIGGDFMQLPSEVVGKLKEEIRMEENRAKKSRRSQGLIRRIGSLDSGYLTMAFIKCITILLIRCTPSTPRMIFDWEFLANHSINTSFFESTHSYPLLRPPNGNPSPNQERVLHELFIEFFASIEFESIACRYEPEHKGVKFRLGGEERKISLLELGWRLGFQSIKDGEFVVGCTSVKEVRGPRVRLAHRYITTTISGQKDSTQRITEIDLFYLYCIYALGKKSLIAMGIVMELHGGSCYWVVAREAGEGDEAEEAAEEEAGGSVDMYQYMSRGY
ncbi:hypothetical protein Tco_0722816 [Tanacetum coccineum]